MKLVSRTYATIQKQNQKKVRIILHSTFIPKSPAIKDPQTYVIWICQICVNMVPKYANFLNTQSNEFAHKSRPFFTRLTVIMKVICWKGKPNSTSIPVECVAAMCPLDSAHVPGSGPSGSSRLLTLHFWAPISLWQRNIHPSQHQQRGQPLVVYIFLRPW